MVIPTFGIDGALVNQAIRSAMSQVGIAKEVVVVGHTSMSHEIEALPSTDDLVWVPTTDYLPISEARNLALKHSDADWFAWLDADDELEVDCLQNLLKAANGGDFVVGRTRVVEAGGSSLRPSPRSVVSDELVGTGDPDDPLMNWVFAIQPQLVRASILNDLSGFSVDYRYAELTDLFLRYVSMSGTTRIAFTDHAVYRYNRTRIGSHSSDKQQLSEYRCRAISDYGRRQTGFDHEVSVVGWVSERQMQRFITKRKEGDANGEDRGF
ncbi:hypothetical protein E3G67_003688 [Mycobacteroides abscessus]|nr:hypothetical protein [Mycobacteroides abscessus]